MRAQEPPIKSRFGSTEASAAYARLKKISVENEVLKVYDVRIDESEVSILLFNSFKFCRNLQTQTVSLFERDYATGQWEPCDIPQVMTVIPVWPIRNLKRELTRAVKGELLKKLYRAADCDRLEARFRNEVDERVSELTSQGMSFSAAVDVAKSTHPDLEKLNLAKSSFSDRLFGGQRGRKGKAGKGFVSDDAVYNGLKGLRTAFFNHFRDPELFRAILSMNHKFMSLGDYLYFAKNRSGVLKVWSERRNLMPLLPYIARDRWNENELFSVENWTSRTGMVAHERFSWRSREHIPSQASDLMGRLVPFNSRRAFKWLAGSKNSVVKAWARERHDPRVADMMTEMNLPKETAVLVIARIVSELSDALAKMDQFGMLHVEDFRPHLLRMFKAYATHWTERRKEIGYRAMVQEMVGCDTGDVLDYLINEGFQNNLPARNATWLSLERRSAEWHHEPMFGLDELYVGEIEKFEWVSLVGQMTVDGCLVIPLTDVESVVEEGAAMHHCVGGYALPCSKDRYRIFSIVEPDGTKSTLGISVSRETAEFDQVRGSGNGPVSERVRRIAEYVTAMYAQAVYSSADETLQPEVEAEAA